MKLTDLQRKQLVVLVILLLYLDFISFAFADFLGVTQFHTIIELLIRVKRSATLQILLNLIELLLLTQLKCLKIRKFITLIRFSTRCKG